MVANGSLKMTQVWNNVPRSQGAFPTSAKSVYACDFQDLKSILANKSDSYPMNLVQKVNDMADIANNEVAGFDVRSTFEEGPSAFLRNLDLGQRRTTNESKVHGNGEYKLQEHFDKCSSLQCELREIIADLNERRAELCGAEARKAFMGIPRTVENLIKSQAISLEKFNRLCVKLQRAIGDLQAEIMVKRQEAIETEKICSGLRKEVEHLNHQLGERDYQNSFLRDTFFQEKVEFMKEMQLLEVELANMRIQQEGMANFIRTHRIDQLPDLEKELNDLRKELESTAKDRQYYENQLMHLREQSNSAIDYHIQERDRYVAKLAAQSEELERMREALQQYQSQSMAQGSKASVVLVRPKPVSMELPLFHSKLTCYHCKSTVHNWSKCELLSQLPEEHKQHLIEQYKKLTDAEKKMEKERKRAQRIGIENRQPKFFQQAPC